MVATLGLAQHAPPPADTAYRLDVGAVLARTFSLSFSQLGVLWTAGLAVYSPALLLVLLAAVLPLSPEGTKALSAVADVADRLLSLVLVGGVCYAVSEALHGRRASVGDVFRFGVSRWGRVFVASLFSGLATLLGFVLCLVPGFFVLAAVWLTVPIALLEDEGASAAVARSRAITEGNRLRGLLVNLLMLVPIVVVGAVLFGTVAVVFALTQDGDASMSPRVEAAVSLAVSFVLIPLECLYATAPVVAYHELRVHREGATSAQLAGVFE